MKQKNGFIIQIKRNGMENKQPLLSICIPTYKIAHCLQTSLERFKRAITPDMDIELIVSDNCSPDETPEVVRAAMDDGLKCSYIRNEKKLGADGNFLQCFNRANGKYIWLCGDDDYLIPEKFKPLYDMLDTGDYGLVELSQDETKFNLQPKVFSDSGDFLSEIHVWITFVSGNIIRKEVVDKIDSSRYTNTHLLQVPYFLTSATIGLPNLMYYPQVLECGADSGNNGGYNLFEVFCENLLTIIHEKVEEKKLSKRKFDKIRKSIYCNWMITYVLMFYVNQDKGKFKTKGTAEILMRWYKYQPYFYYYTAYRVLRRYIKLVIN